MCFIHEGPVLIRCEQACTIGEGEGQFSHLPSRTHAISALLLRIPGKRLQTIELKHEILRFSWEIFSIMTKALWQVLNIHATLSQFITQVDAEITLTTEFTIILGLVATVIRKFYVEMSEESLPHFEILATLVDVLYGEWQ